MDNNKMTFADFFKKYAWLLAIISAFIAILVLLLPILDYEIREAVYDAEGNRIFKKDYVYSMNLISFFTTGFRYNFSMYVTVGVIVLGMIFFALSNIKKDLFVIGGMTILIAVCLLILSKEFFAADGNAVMDHAKVVGTTYDESTQTFSASLHGVSLTWGAAVSMVFCMISFFISTISNFHRTTREIAEEGVLIALAFVLNLAKLPITTSGGSINFQMLPLMIIALRHGPAHGFIAGGIVYGLLTCLTDGYGLVTYPFDYLIAFGSVALMGLFNKYIMSDEQKTYNIKGIIFIIIGGVLATFFRFIGSTASSMVIYEYKIIPAMEYNAVYITVSGAIALGVLIMIYGPLLRIHHMFPVKPGITQ